MKRKRPKKEDTDTGKNKTEEEEPYGKEFVDLRKHWLVETGYSNNTGKEAHSDCRGGRSSRFAPLVQHPILQTGG